CSRLRSTSLAGWNAGSRPTAAPIAEPPTAEVPKVDAPTAEAGAETRTDARTEADARIGVPPPSAAIPLGGGTDGTRVGSGGAAAARTGAGPGRAGRVAGADEGEVGSGGVSGSRGRGTSGLEPAEATGGWVGPAGATGGWVGAPIAGGLGTPDWPGTLATARARWKLSTRS